MKQEAGTVVRTFVFSVALCIVLSLNGGVGAVSNSKVAVELDAVNFASTLTNDDKMWLVEFASGLCTYTLLKMIMNNLIARWILQGIQACMGTTT